MVRSKNGGFTTQIIPGIGAGKNVVFIADERDTDNISQLEARNLIKVDRNIKEEVINKDI